MLIITKCTKGNDCTISWDRLTVLTLFEICTSFDGCLSIYQVSFNTLLYFRKYSGQAFICKKMIGNYSVRSDAIGTISRSSIIVSSFMKLSYVLLKLCPGQKCN